MSVKVSHLVWEYAELKGSPLIVLLAMADFADDDGSNVYPSRKTLAKKARIDERSVSRILTDLENAGMVRVEETETGAHGRYRNYTIVLEALIPPEFLAAHREMQDRTKNKTEGQNVPRSKRGGHSSPNRETKNNAPGDNSRAHIDNHPRPVLEPPLAAAAGRPEGAGVARTEWNAALAQFDEKEIQTGYLAMAIPRGMEGEHFVVEFATITARDRAARLGDRLAAALKKPVSVRVINRPAGTASLVFGANL